jgi:hypothetical protein
MNIGLYLILVGTANGFNTPKAALKLKVRLLRMPRGPAPRLFTFVNIILQLFLYQLFVVKRIKPVVEYHFV